MRNKKRLKCSYRTRTRMRTIGRCGAVRLGKYASRYESGGPYRATISQMLLLVRRVNQFDNECSDE